MKITKDIKLPDSIRPYLHKGQVREIYAVTEWRDGCVYRTKSLGYVVMSSDKSCLVEGSEAQIHPPSSRVY